GGALALRRWDWRCADRDGSDQRQRQGEMPCHLVLLAFLIRAVRRDRQGASGPACCSFRGERAGRRHSAPKCVARTRKTHPRPDAMDYAMVPSFGGQSARWGYTIAVRIDPRTAGHLNRERRGKAGGKDEGNEPMTKTGIQRARPGGTAAIVSMCGLLFGACATVPSGPGVMALPGSGKSFEQFQIDDTACRQWASQQTG